MSAIARLYADVHKAVPNCQYVRVPRWHLRTTWEAVPRDGEFTPEEREKIAAIFERFEIDVRELDREQRECFGAQLWTPLPYPPGLPVLPPAATRPA